MKRDLHFEMMYPHSREHVWRAITNSEAMSRWLMPNDFEPVVGHRFQFRTKAAPGFDGIVNCEVLEVLPPERLVYTWKGGGVDTVLTWTLQEAREGTRLLLDHTGFAGLRGLMVSRILGSGWRSKILSVHLPRLLNAWDGERQLVNLNERECH
jgi:uncharacterized protein YndB with AHSA1/START domain